ncbi:MAG: 2-oxoacid:acceptor oxidoreductase family protein [Actinobacteria bacterium]|nr:2-oxoacid:acceptor oxidoreductase family protein [Actinomycetota bacterium]
MSGQTAIRMSGLGGQGVVTAAHIIGSAAVIDGKNAVVNPFFGAEKRLAPAESYVRISTEEIWDTGEVLYPNIILIFHPDVILKGKSYTMPFFSGLRKGGVIVVNSERTITFEPDERSMLEEMGASVHFVPATSIAKNVGGTELAANMAMLGGLIGASEIVSMAAMEEALTERFAGTKKFVASGTTAALDDQIRKQYDKTEKLISSNMNVLRASAELVAGRGI